MTLAQLVARARGMPPHIVLRKALGLAGRELRAGIQYGRDRLFRSYGCAASDGRFLRYLGLSAADIPADLVVILPKLTDAILQHRFDLLGSGWVEVRHGMNARGCEGHRYPPGPSVQADRRGDWLKGRINRANLAYAQQLWRRIENSAYRPIDWQIDIKSGYRWSEDIYFRDIRFGHRPGIDIKLPWELARMQHLPWLAQACILSQAGYRGFADPKTYRDEIRNQIIDFIANNPPRFGVNWRCAMDVSIRIANWLITIDMLRGAGMDLGSDWEAAVIASARDHGHHIVSNLEWSEETRSNHYLADIAGLLFVSAYLPCSDKTDAWLAFAIQQMDLEIRNQFDTDGANFEGSTGYHCLSSELVAYSAALILGLPEEKKAALLHYDHRKISVRPPFHSAPMREGNNGYLSEGSAMRISGMQNFLHSITKPDGHIVQIGDFDSGRFLKLHPITVSHTGSIELDEDMLDRKPLSSALAALFEAEAPQDAHFDGMVVRSLSKGRTFPQPLAVCNPTLPGADMASMLQAVAGLPSESLRVTEINVGLTAEPPDIRIFDQFGLCILRWRNAFLSMRYNNALRPGAPTGHVHDDSLSIELQVEGRSLIIDPGSYLYTPAPEIRQRYRGADAHFVPRPAACAALIPDGLFGSRSQVKGRCLHCSATGIAAVIEGDGWQAYRIIELLDDRLRITDACTPGPLAQLCGPIKISKGYGKLTEDTARSF